MRFYMGERSPSFHTFKDMEILEQRRLGSKSTSSKLSRIPLLSQISNSKTPTLSGSRKVRRKSSFICRIGSSEEYPSSHESIYHAECLSNTGSDYDGHPLETWRFMTPSPITGLATSVSTTNQNENRHLLSPKIGSAPILYGHGTALTTIVEQKSTATMCTKVSSTHLMSTSETSLPYMSTPNLLGHRDSFELPATVTLRPPRRRKSFSADDLVLIKRSYHDACLMIENITGRPFSVHELYTEPQAPVIPAFERPSTPPGMPSWAASQNGSLPQLLPAQAPPNRLRRFLGIQSRPAIPSLHIPVLAGAQQSAGSNQRIRSMQYRPGQTRSRVPPRFRPQGSGHGVANLESHPFIRSINTVIKSEPTSTMARTPPSNNQPTGPLGSQSNISTAARKNRLTNTRSLFAAGTVDSSRIPDPPTARVPLTSQSTTAAGPAQCPHRRGRQAVLRTLNQRPSQATLAQQLPVSQSPIPGPAIAIDHQMSGAIPSSGPPASQSANSRPVSLQCWKCRVSTAASTIDNIWEMTSNWCCWIVCGAEADDGESTAVSYGGRNGNRSRDTLVGPRRVFLDGCPL